jgi:hypothetical protein
MKTAVHKINDELTVVKSDTHTFLVTKTDGGWKVEGAITPKVGTKHYLAATYEMAVAIASRKAA